MNEIYALLFIIAASQGIILSLGLAFNKRKSPENRILAVLTLLISIDLLIGYYYYKSDVPFEEMTIANYALDFFEYSLVFLYGPIFYFYSMRLISRIKNLKPSHILHTIPFLLTAAYSIFLFTVNFGDHDSALYQFLYETWDIVDYYISFLTVISVPIYFIFSYIHLKQFSARIKTFYSNTGRITLNWLKRFIIVSLIYSSILTVFMVILFFADVGSFIDSDLYYICMSLMVFILGYYALAQPAIFDKIHMMEKGLKDEPKLDKAEEKYKKTKLEGRQSERILDKIITHTTESKCFIDPDINLQKLADDLEIPTHYISQVINSRLNQNFFQFINHYRIEEVKSILIDPARSDSSILAIAFDSGFNTKSTFNATFKQFTGMTPSQYRKNT